MPYPNQHACRLRDPGDFQEGSFRTMHRDHEGKQYAVIVGKLKGESAMTEQAYRYDKETWTAGAAKNHCDSHDGSFVAADDRPGPNEENTMYPNRQILNFTHNSTVADSEPSWGSVDKTALPRAAFADQGETDKKSTWGYPHHFIQNAGGKDENGVWTTGTMFLHEGGLNAAWAAAQGARSGQSASAEVKAHLEAHRRALGKTEDFCGIYFKAQTDSAEIWIYDEIGSGWFGGMSAKQFADEFRKLGKVENISLRINSPGGDVFDGLAIYNLLKQSKARIIVNIDGLAASIASIIAMAGDEINMAENAIMMIHKSWGMSIGNADEMQKMSETLTKLDSTLASTYAKQTGLDLGAISQMMADETWMNSQEAMAFGFITNITDEMKLAAHFDLGKYKFKKNPLAERVSMQPENRLEGTGTPMRSETGAPLRTGDNGMEILETAISKCESIINRS